MRYHVTAHASLVWEGALRRILNQGNLVSPRGMQTREVQGLATVLDMRRCVITTRERGLNYRFMAAEAHWILSGDESVQGIVPYNKNLAPFSDDGKIFNGAYGPRIKSQLPFVVDTLEKDRDSRQAVLTIWRENGVCRHCNGQNIGRHCNDGHEFEITRDVPCTVSLAFQVRERGDGLFLDCHAYMRSNDLWLGYPYDVFNFSMVSALVCARLSYVVLLGDLYHYAASGHLYERNWDQAAACAYTDTCISEQRVPLRMLYDEPYLMRYLDNGRHAPANTPANLLVE